MIDSNRNGIPGSHVEKPPTLAEVNTAIEKAITEEDIIELLTGRQFAASEIVDSIQVMVKESKSINEFNTKFTIFRSKFKFKTGRPSVDYIISQYVDRQISLNVLSLIRRYLYGKE